tara:strand:- start:6631 stop:7353 length:723 start_codon:yes stop_codon:yes gene_type:complete
MNKPLYDNYLTTFKKKLWNKCLEESIFDNIPENEVENVKNIFENTIENYKVQILQSEGNDSIMNLLLRNINNEVKSKKAITREDINNIAANQFDNALQEKQNEYNKLLNNTPPETPNFNDDTQDEPLNNENLEMLIKEQLKSREITLPPTKEPFTEISSVVTSTNSENEFEKITEKNTIVMNNNFPNPPEMINIPSPEYNKNLETISNEISQLKQILQKQNMLLEKIVSSQVLLLKNKIK